MQFRETWEMAISFDPTFIAFFDSLFMATILANYLYLYLKSAGKGAKL